MQPVSAQGPEAMRVRRFFAGIRRIGIVLALILALPAFYGFWTWLILGSLFVADSTVTLLRRILRGDRWYEAHRTHAYPPTPNLALNQFALFGTWRVTGQSATAVRDARIDVAFQAAHVYLVLSSAGGLRRKITPGTRSIR